MATPIDNKALLAQFIGGDKSKENHSTKRPSIAQSPQSLRTADREKEQGKKNLRFSITVPTPLAITIREYVTQATIAHLINGDGYSLSQFFSEAALHYMQEKQPVSKEG